MDKSTRIEIKEPSSETSGLIFPDDATNNNQAGPFGLIGSEAKTIKLSSESGSGSKSADIEWIAPPGSDTAALQLGAHSVEVGDRERLGGFGISWTKKQFGGGKAVFTVHAKVLLDGDGEFDTWKVSVELRILWFTKI